MPTRSLADVKGRKNQPKDHAENANKHRRVQQQQQIDKPAVHLSVGLRGTVGGGIVVVQVIVVLGFDVGNVGKVENDRQNGDDGGDADVRNLERLAARAFARGVLGIEIHAADDRSEDPADAVGGLGQIDARCRIARIAQHRRVRIGDRFQKRQSGGNGANADKETDKRDVG